MPALGRDAQLLERWNFPGFKEGFLWAMYQAVSDLRKQICFLTVSGSFGANKLWAPQLPAPHPALEQPLSAHLCLGPRTPTPGAGRGLTGG